MLWGTATPEQPGRSRSCRRWAQGNEAKGTPAHTWWKNLAPLCLERALSGTRLCCEPEHTHACMGSQGGACWPLQLERTAERA